MLCPRYCKPSVKASDGRPALFGESIVLRTCFATSKNGRRRQPALKSSKQSAAKALSYPESVCLVAYGQRLSRIGSLTSPTSQPTTTSLARLLQQRRGCTPRLGSQSSWAAKSWG